MNLKSLELEQINRFRGELRAGTMRVLERGFNVHNMVTDALPTAYAVLSEADHSPFQAEFDIAYMGLSARIAEERVKANSKGKTYFYTPGYRGHDENAYLDVMHKDFTAEELVVIEEHGTEEKTD